MNFQEKAAELFNQGYSCSESVVRAAYECKLIDSKLNVEQLTQMASAFSGGMGESGCLCGAVAGAQIVLGSIFGRKDKNIPAGNIKKIAREFIEKFKKQRKATCCRALSAGFDFHSPERRGNCAGIVTDVTMLLEKYIEENLSAAKSLI